jgi:hypothetical protein
MKEKKSESGKILIEYIFFWFYPFPKGSPKETKVILTYIQVMGVIISNKIFRP